MRPTRTPTACALFVGAVVLANAVACRPGEPPREPPSAPSTPSPPVPPALTPPAPPPPAVEAAPRSRGADVAERLFRGDPVVTELAALDEREREALATRVDERLVDPPAMMPIRPVLAALSRAWSLRAEPIVARYLVHADQGLRQEAREIVRAHGLSSAAVATRALPKDPSADARAAVADAVSRAPDGDLAAVERLCKSVGASADAEWQCAATLSRLGSSTARANLVTKVRAACASAPYQQVVDRFEWLANELGRLGPWRALGDQLRNTRAAPIVLCGDNFDASPGSGCTTVGYGPPIGDAFLRQVVAVYALTPSFALDQKSSFTAAQRAEVLRLLSATKP